MNHKFFMKKKKIKKKNFLVRFLIKILRKIGYEIIDQSDLTIQKSSEILDKETDVQYCSITLPLGKINLERKIKNVLVIQRVFTKENQLLSQNKKRIFEEDKKEYSLRSIFSILKSCEYANKVDEELKFIIKIIDDNSNIEVIKQIKKIIEKFKKLNIEIINLKVSNYESKMNFSNNSRYMAHNAHIYQSKEIALNTVSDAVYFVEDDYIHQKECLYEMIKSYEKFENQSQNDLVLLPTDYPYLYFDTKKSSILIGNCLHWRIVDQSLCTYFTTKKFVKKYWTYFEQMMTNINDPYEKPLHELYEKTLCLSPIPSLAVHLTNINSIYGISPTINVKKLWKENNYE